MRPVPLGEGPRPADFSVAENGLPYILSDSGDAGTYQVITRDDEIEVRWYFSARSEEKTFSVRYEVPVAVVCHLDAAVRREMADSAVGPLAFVGQFRNFGDESGDRELPESAPLLRIDVTVLAALFLLIGIAIWGMSVKKDLF